MFDSLHRELALFERAVQILKLVRENDPVGIRRLSRQSGHEHHETRAALGMLEDEGYIEATPEGAVPTEEAETFLTELDESLDDVSTRIEALASCHLSRSAELTQPPEFTHAKR
ncbi:Predicted transcriptional regulator [Haladaptatus litoreus]|uniref:Predicted transcriptional regulator n=1 Tax=Haladaptatus litoreus TaxID=553468 RepID=A0A1N6YT45_9EURY|nr:hypothetical protein [Haladaptatus litoreus]SIR17561.1 Predicted transcriptional regulator [Haladaptatus litoreus]